MERVARAPDDQRRRPDRPQGTGRSYGTAPGSSSSRRTRERANGLANWSSRLAAVLGERALYIVIEWRTPGTRPGPSTGPCSRSRAAISAKGARFLGHGSLSHAGRTRTRPCTRCGSAEGDRQGRGRAHRHPDQDQLVAEMKVVDQAQHVLGQHPEVEGAKLGELGLPVAPGVGGQDGGGTATDLGARYPPQLLQVAPEAVQEHDGARAGRPGLEAVMRPAPRTSRRPRSSVCRARPAVTSPDRARNALARGTSASVASWMITGTGRGKPAWRAKTRS